MPSEARGPRDDLEGRVSQLEAIVERLEAQIESFQDTIHRQAVRYDRDIGELRERVDPAQLARDLSDDARRRGL